MTITSSTSAPLIVVVGSTGTQGGSVVKALAASTKSYRVRAITRDTSKPAAQALVALDSEVVAADTTVPEDLAKAFEGADLAFLFTTSEYTVLNAAETEYNKGKLQVDAAKAAGISTILLSSEPNLAKLSGGKFQSEFFQGKADVATYARETLGLKVYETFAPSYATNLLGMSPPRKQEDGSFKLVLPYDTERLLPISDIAEDFGKYVIAAYENNLEQAYAAPKYITPTEVAASFAKASGKQVTAARIPLQVLESILAGHVGPIGAKHICEMHNHFEEYGYFGGENKVVDLSPSNTILSAPARSFDEFLAANKAAVDQIFA